MFPTITRQLSRINSCVSPQKCYESWPENLEREVSSKEERESKWSIRVNIRRRPTLKTRRKADQIKRDVFFFQPRNNRERWQGTNIALIRAITKSLFNREILAVVDSILENTCYLDFDSIWHTRVIRYCTILTDSDQRNENH